MPADLTVEADFCVVGCGPAGITVAHHLVAAGGRVVVVETGGLDSDPAAQELADGPAVGPIIKDYPTYLRDSRRFRVGGAGASWGSEGRMWCIPFTPLDFAPREWVPESGWPVTAADIEPYASRAAAFLAIPPFEPPTSLAGAAPVSDDPLISRVYYYPPDSGVFMRTFAMLRAQDRFRAMLRATAVRFAVRGERVEAIWARQADGTGLRIEAGSFILAAGGVENARLLLLHRAGWHGAPHTTLGRYFMEHFHVYVGRAWFPDAGPWTGYLATSTDRQTGHGRLRVLGLSEQAQHRERLLNATIQLTFDDAAPTAGPLVCGLLVRSEQVPNPLSRVELVPQRDRLGRPRAALTWLPTDLDWDSVVRTVWKTCMWRAVRCSRQAASPTRPSRSSRLRSASPTTWRDEASNPRRPARPCPADHGMGPRSQRRMAATSTVPR
jgi:glycine/D-amino acid oxidase-like deaminating enzyme